MHFQEPYLNDVLHALEKLEQTAPTKLKSGDSYSFAGILCHVHATHTKNRFVLEENGNESYLGHQYLIPVNVTNFFGLALNPSLFIDGIWLDLKTLIIKQIGFQKIHHSLKGE